MYAGLLCQLGWIRFEQIDAISDTEAYKYMVEPGWGVARVAIRVWSVCFLRCISGNLRGGNPLNTLLWLIGFLLRF
jgi:hypothetical protein